MLTGDKRGKRIQSGDISIGRNGIVITPKGKLRSAKDAVRLGALNCYIIAQQRIAQFDLTVEGIEERLEAI